MSRIKHTRIKTMAIMVILSCASCFPWIAQGQEGVSFSRQPSAQSMAAPNFMPSGQVNQQRAVPNTVVPNTPNAVASPAKSGDLQFTPSVLTTKMYYEGAETIGRVGHEAILKRDILHQLKKHAWLTWYGQMKKMSEQEQAAHGEELKKQIMQEFSTNPKIYSDILDEYIKKLLFFNDFVVSRPKEQLEEQQKKLEEAYEREYVPQLLKELKLANRKELEEFFTRDTQSSIEQDKRIFLHETLGSSWLEFNLGEDNFEPNTVDLRRYYEAHLDLYEQKERVKWRAMSVMFSNHADRNEAMQKMALMGNEVLKARTTEEQERLFAEVAKRMSEDVFASKGGDRGWIGRGSLNSKTVENAVFSTDLPVGRLSCILEDVGGYVIVLVTKRETASYKPFVQVQEEVRKKLLADRRAAMSKHYEEELAKRFTIELFNITSDQRKAQLEALLKDNKSVTGRDVY